MNNVLLINRIIPTIDDDRICNITFVIADMHLQEVHDKIIKVIDSSEYMDLNNTEINYNGFTTKQKAKLIPEIMKVLVENKLKVYGVYDLYS